MKLTVLAMSNCNWHGFTQFCQEHNLQNPNASVLDSRIAKSPASYVASLSFDGDGISNLVNNQTGFEHGFMTVICKLDKSSTVLAIATNRNMITSIVNAKERIVLVSASYVDWYNSIVTKLRRAHRDELAEFYSQVCILLEAHGFRELFRKHPRTMDGGILTFI